MLNVLPAPEELGAEWSADRQITPRSREFDYKYKHGGKSTIIITDIRVSHSLDQLRNEWFTGRRVPNNMAWKMEPIAGVGERALFAQGQHMAYFQFNRGNVYVFLKMFAHPNAKEAFTHLAKAIDARLLALNPHPDLAFGDLLTQAEVAPVVAKILPLVEELAGRRFKRPPVVRVVSMEEFIPAYAQDLSLQLVSKRQPGREEDFDYLIGLRARSLAHHFAGRFSYSQRELLLPAETFYTGLRRNHIPPDQFPASLAIIIAHELVHALQDQEVDLGKMLAGCAHDEARGAFSAVIEGQAIFVQKRIADRLGYPPAVRSLGQPESAQADLDPRAERTRSAAIFVYQQGPEFIERLYQKGGLAEIWKVIAHPPTRSADITNTAGATNQSADGKPKP